MDINVWPRCDNRCIMCTNPVHLRSMPLRPFTFPMLVNAIESANAANSPVRNRKFTDVFVLTGGEPALNPELPALLKWISMRHARPRAVMLTNGRAFSSRAFAGKCLACGPGMELAVSLHGDTAALHDLVTGVKGSFRETVAGLKNIFALKGRGQLLEIRIVVHRINKGRIGKILDFVRRNFSGVDRLTVIFPEFEGYALVNYRRLALKYEDCTDILKDLAKALRSRSMFKEVCLYHFPLCRIPRRLRPLARRTLPDEELVTLAACRRCGQKGACPGVPKSYVEVAGPKGFGLKKIAPEADQPLAGTP